MDNRLNIPVPPDRSDEGTWEARSAGLWKCRSKVVGRMGKKIYLFNSENRKAGKSSDDPDWLTLCRQEKLLNVKCRETVP